MDRLMRMTTTSGRTITVPVTNLRITETQIDDQIEVRWSADVDVLSWLTLLTPRLAMLAPERSASQVARDLGAFAAGEEQAWIVFVECYNIPKQHAREWHALQTEATRLLALALWLDEVGLLTELLESPAIQ